MSSSYNLTKVADRKRFIADTRAELEAIKNGTWPRNVDDELRHNNPGFCHSRLWTDVAWAERMCELKLEHLLHKATGLEVRLSTGDPELEGWEGWVPFTYSMAA